MWIPSWVSSSSSQDRRRRHHRLVATDESLRIRCMSTFPSPFRNCGDPTSSKHPFERNPRWVFPKIRVPQNGWFIMENPIKIDDLGGFTTPIFGSTPRCFLQIATQLSPRAAKLFVNSSQEHLSSQLLHTSQKSSFLATPQHCCIDGKRTTTAAFLGTISQKWAVMFFFF